jgi:cob(I)alamin adenosyltransferase
MDIREKEQNHQSKSKFITLHGSRLTFGLTHYYFGDGKGKTTTLIGLIIRALGHNLKPLLIQFLKRHTPDEINDGFFMGEVNFLRHFIDIRQFGSGKFVNKERAKDKNEIKNAERGLKFATEQIMSGEYDVVALDEIVNAISMNLIELEDLIQLIKNKPDHVEIICTGMMFYKELGEIVDYAVSYNSFNHPYEKGILARKGIEY